MPPPLPLPPLADQPPERKPSTRRQWVIWLAMIGLLIAIAWPVGQFLRWSERVTVENRARALLTGQQDAWNRGDLDEFMAGYWQDDRLTFSSGGTVTRGWQATLDRYRQRYQAEGKEMGRLTFSDLEIEPLGAEAALVRGRWALAFAKSADKPSGLYTLLMRKTADGWKIVHDHTSAAEPPKKD